MNEQIPVEKKNSEIHTKEEVDAWIKQKKGEGCEVSIGHEEAYPPNYFAGRLESIKTDDEKWVWAETPKE